MFCAKRFGRGIWRQPSSVEFLPRRTITITPDRKRNIQLRKLVTKVNFGQYFGLCKHIQNLLRSIRGQTTIVFANQEISCNERVDDSQPTYEDLSVLHVFRIKGVAACQQSRSHNQRIPIGKLITDGQFRALAYGGFING